MPWMMVTQNKFVRIFIKAILFVLTITSLITAIHTSLHNSGDFETVWNVAWYLVRGNDVYNHEFYRMHQIQPNYPPSCYLLISPFTLMNFQTAKVIWLIIKLVITVLLARMLCDMYLGKQQYWLLLSLIILCSLWRNDIRVGQLSLLSIYYFVLSVKFHNAKKTILSGLAISISLLKYPLIIPMLLYFVIYKRSWKNVAIGFGFHATVHMMVSIILRKSPIYLFTQEIAYSKIINLFTSGYLDVHAFWYRISNSSGWVPTIASIVIVCIWIICLVKKQFVNDLGMITFTSMISTIIIYHRSYDYLIVIYPIVWLLTKRTFNKALIFISVSVFLVAYTSIHYSASISGVIKKVMNVCVDKGTQNNPTVNDAPEKKQPGQNTNVFVGSRIKRANNPEETFILLRSYYITFLCLLWYATIVVLYYELKKEKPTSLINAESERPREMKT